MQSFFRAVYIDNHTHLHGIIDKKDNILQVFAIDSTDLIGVDSISAIIEAGHQCTLGLHPRNIHELDFDEFRDIVESHADSLLAIGECGLDTFVSIDKQDQITAFKMQAYLAEELEKPLIIHCVRSYSEIIRLHREIQPKKPWIIHGFNRNRDIAESLLEQGIILSIGNELMKEDHPLSSFVSHMKEIPFLLETDGKDIEIEQIYQRCAILLGLDIAQLKERIATHFKQIYGTN